MSRTPVACVPEHVELTCYDEPTEDGTLTLVMQHPNRFGAFKACRKPLYLGEHRRENWSGYDANEVLGCCARLRTFDSIEHTLHVDEMLRQPWACKGLEWLTVQIRGVSRLTDGEQIVVDRVMVPGYSGDVSVDEEAAVEKFERCQAQQHGVYDRLASLTRLKHLDLGYENRDPAIGRRREVERYEVGGKEYVRYNGPMFDTLEMSLASGLDRLGALKDLEMIRFECINYRIGRPELEWMAQSWRKLNLMYGLDKEPVQEAEPLREEFKEYFQKLQPDVVHGTLFMDEV
ncbi:hypothetical protein BGZ52_003709 [Haplosporangium bisporale]|nr:hypothetical protein BGZ52_003709 [Haplosporangium bisporale]